MFDAKLDLALVTDELAEHCYPDTLPIERKHEVAVLRAFREALASGTAVTAPAASRVDRPDGESEQARGAAQVTGVECRDTGLTG